MLRDQFFDAGLYLPIRVFFCLKAADDDHDPERGSLLGTTGASVPAEEKKGKTVKAALYGVQVFYSFFIM